MFLGTHPGKLDKDSRLLAPKSFRQQLAGGSYIIQGFDRNVIVLGTAAFQEIYRRVSSQNIADPLARLLLRLVLGSAHELEVDQQGYINIPEELKAFAGIQEAVLLVGQGEYFEIWQPEQWQNQESQIRDVETNASRFAALSITIG